MDKDELMLKLIQAQELIIELQKEVARLKEPIVIVNNSGISFEDLRND